METPGQVLRLLRKARFGETQIEFGGLEPGMGRAGWGKEVQKNLERGRTKFTKEHLEILVARGVMKEGDEWHQRFLQAMAHEREANEQQKEQRLREKDKPPDGRSSINVSFLPKSPAQIGTTVRISVSLAERYRSPAYSIAVIIDGRAEAIQAGPECTWEWDTAEDTKAGSHTIRIMAIHEPEEYLRMREFSDNTSIPPEAAWSVVGDQWFFYELQPRDTCVD